MTPYHTSQQKVKLALALIAALIVEAYDSRWLAGPVGELIPPGSGIRLEWLCRIRTKILGALTAVVQRALTRGRPPRELPPAADHALDDELKRVREQYVLRRKAEGKHKAQEWLVETYRRLSHTFGVSKKSFCARVGVAARSLRFWAARALKPSAPPTPLEPPPERRPRGEGRFDLEHTLPGIQQISDTTDWKFLGVLLKIMATQDPGKRKKQILSAVAVAVAESGERIMSLVDEVAPPGTQVITDRGTPFMSQSDAMQERQQEHAPCKEYTPTEKATIERAFGVIKQAFAPVVEFLDVLVEKFPGLRSAEIAVKLASLLLGVFLDIYRSGRRDDGHPLERSDPELLRCIAEEQLEKARSGLESKLSTLERIHDQYAMRIGRYCLSGPTRPMPSKTSWRPSAECAPPPSETI